MSSIDVRLFNSLRIWSEYQLIFIVLFGQRIGSQIKGLIVVCHVAWYIFNEDVIILQNLEHRYSFLTFKNIQIQ